MALQLQSLEGGCTWSLETCPVSNDTYKSCTVYAFIYFIYKGSLHENVKLMTESWVINASG